MNRISLKINSTTIGLLGLVTELSVQPAKSTRDKRVADCSLGIRLANERRRYNLTSSRIGWSHIQNVQCTLNLIEQCSRLRVRYAIIA